MNEVSIFTNEEFGNIRTMVINNEPWFVGKDIADILGYSKARNAIAAHVDEDDALKWGVTDSIGRTQETTLINESGLYSLILSSKLPTAKKFKRWVTSEVLPSIRKTGGYISNADMFVESYFSDLSDESKVVLRELLHNTERIKEKNEVLTQQLDIFSSDTLEWVDRNLINALVRRYAARALDNNFAQAWVDFKKELLYKYSICINSRMNSWLNKNGKKSKPKTLEMIDDCELSDSLRTIVAMCHEHDVDIDDLLKGKEV